MPHAAFKAQRGRYKQNKMTKITNKTEKNVEEQRRYFQGNDGIMVLPADEIEKVYDLSGFEGFSDDDIGDGDTIVSFRDEKVKVSSISSEIEVFEYYDGNNWKKLYLTNVFEEMPLHEVEEYEYSTKNLKGYYNLSYDHIVIVKFREDNFEKYGVILSYRSSAFDELFFITKKEYEALTSKEYTGDVFDIISSAGYEI